MIAIDLHTHTCASPDGGLRVEHFEKMLASGQLDVVAVTDHNTIVAARQLQAAFGDHIIIGEEISTAQGDLIGLYLTDPVPPGLPAQQTAEHIHAQGGLVYVPHPFEVYRSSGGQSMLDTLAGHIDIIETYNGRTVLQKNNRVAAAWAAEHDIPVAASSDAHGWHGWGRVYTKIAAMPTVNALCDLLRHGAPATARPGVRMLAYPKYHRLRQRIQQRKAS